MNVYMITAWTFTSVLVSDVELVGADVVIGKFEGENEQEAKEKASLQHGIPVSELDANQIVVSTPNV